MPMDPNACIGGCNARYRRAHRAFEAELRTYIDAVVAWRDYVKTTPPEEWEGDQAKEPVKPEEPTVRPWLGEPVWCGTCTAARRQELAELDDIASIYAARSDGHREPSQEGRVSGSSETPSLSPMVDDLDELESWLREWRATHSRIDTPARQGYLASAITTGTAWLLVRAEHILARPEYGAEFGRELHQWHTRLTAASKTSIAVHRKPLRCDTCHMMRLEHRDGDDSVRCATPGCGRVLRLDEYDALVEKASASIRRAS